MEDLTSEPRKPRLIVSIPDPGEDKAGSDDDQVDETQFFLKTSESVRLNQSKVSRAVKAIAEEEIRRTTVTFGDRVFSLIKLSIPVTIAGAWSFCFNFMLPKNVLVDLVHAFVVTGLVLLTLYFINNSPHHEDFDTTVGKFYKLGGMTFGMMVSWAWTDFLKTFSTHYISRGSKAHLLETNTFLADLAWRLLFGLVVSCCTYYVSYRASTHIIESTEGGKSFSRIVWILLETALICPVAWSLNDILRFFSLHFGPLEPVLWTKCVLNLLLCPFLLHLMSMDIRLPCFKRGRRTEEKISQSNQRKYFWRSVMGAMVAWSILDACDGTLNDLRHHFSTASYVGFNMAHTALFTIIAIGFAAISGKFKFTEAEGLKVYAFETFTMTIGMSFGWSWRDLNKNIFSACLKPSEWGGLAKLLPFASAILTSGLGVWVLLQLVPKNADIDSSFSDSFDSDSEDDREVKDTHQLAEKHRAKHIHHRQTTLPGLRAAIHRQDAIKKHGPAFRTHFSEIEESAEYGV